MCLNTNNSSEYLVPKVSVFMLTYNHEHYIRQALDSVLMQRTRFSVEIVLGEDCSTDTTRNIVLEYALKYPNCIRLLLHDTNVGSSINQYLVLKACTGEYIALLEGDDFWTDEYKLQKQVDFLDSHKDFALCTHNQAIVDADGQTTGALMNSLQPFDTWSVKDLAKGNLIPTASSLYRNNFTNGPSPTGVPVWLKEAKLGDYCMHMLTARFGKIKYMPEVMGAYRVHGAGAWGLKSLIARNIMLFDTLHLLKQEFQGTVKEHLVNQQISNLSKIADHGHATLEFNLPDFLTSRKESILELIKDDYSSFIQTHFSQQRATCSAEYRYGKLVLKPMRWLTGKISR